MGIETAAAVVTAVVAGVSAYEQRRQQKRATEKEEEAKDVARAEQQAQQQQQTRQQIREERIRRAQILQSSQNTGVAGSSGAIGSTGALQTQLGSNLAAASRQANAADAITGLRQQAADYRSRAAEIGSYGSLATGALSAGAGIYAASQGPAVATQPVAAGNQSPATQPNPYDLNNIFR